MAPKAPEKSPQHRPAHNNAATTMAAVTTIVPKHSNPFYISAHTLCHNKRLRQKRSKYVECIRNARNKTEHPLRQKLSVLRPEVTIDLLSDDDDVANNGSGNVVQAKKSVFRGQMCLERAAILGLMPVERLTNVPQPQTSLLVPLNANNSQQQRKTKQHNNKQMLQRKSLHVIQQPSPPSTPQLHNHTQKTPRKRKSRPQKRHSLPTLLNSESIVLSDDSESEQTNGITSAHQLKSPLISIRPDLAVIYPTNKTSPCVPVPSTPSSTTHRTKHHTPSLQMQQNTMQVDEDVTISLVPRNLTATTCARTSSRSSLNTSATQYNNSSSDGDATAVSQPIQSPPFPMLPDETTVHTVIANRIYELSLTKLREGLASCGIPEFSGGQQKISPPRRKGAVQAPPIVTQPQAPISLKLSSDLSISLISDDEDDHHRNNETLLSPAFLQKLPVNVSIAPVVTITPHPLTPPATVCGNVDPRKLKFG